MLVSLTVNSLCVSGLLFIKNHFVLLLEIRCIESAVLANYKQCVSDFITRAAMFSPPVLHFVILPLSCCSPAFIKVLLKLSLALNRSGKINCIAVTLF